MDAVDPRILVAEMLISIGVTTYEKVHDYFKQNGDDDAALAGVMSEVKARLAARGIVVPDPPSS